MSDDQALLQQYAPILRFNKGEQFYPLDAERYLAAARLMVLRPNDFPEELVPRGSVTLDHLTAHYRFPPGSVLYLSVAETLSPIETVLYQRTSPVREFRAGPGRLARVGLLPRLGDVFFSLSLRLRGRVPGGLAAGAARAYGAMRGEQPRYACYGRVVRDTGYTVLQYWFFYSYNDWRSSFAGVNDHEADWEMVAVYLAEYTPGDLRPCWLAYASHNFNHDDIRRRWDDPEIELSGTHPVVYIAAGSHAAYYQAGEYLPSIAVPLPDQVERVWRRIRRIWRVTILQNTAPEGPNDGIIRIPFVDYARGDGLQIGPGTAHEWDLQVWDAAAPAWVEAYRGLWGMYTGDVLEGEDAPSGPKFRRDGALKPQWYDPVGWCGLDKVPTPAQRLDVVHRQIERLRNEQRELEQQIQVRSEQLVGLEVESEAIRGDASLTRHALELRRQVAQVGTGLQNLKAQYALNDQLIDQCEAYAVRLQAGDQGDPRQHLVLPQLPTSPAEMQFGRLAQTWSAVSVGVLLIGFAVIAQFTRNWGSGLLILFAVFIFLESLARRQFSETVRTVVVGLALVAALALLYEFFQTVLVLVAFFVGALIIWENLRELRK